jgi:hypothetical protein
MTTRGTPHAVNLSPGRAGPFACRTPRHPASITNRSPACSTLPPLASRSRSTTGLGSSSGAIAAAIDQ